MLHRTSAGRPPIYIGRPGPTRSLSCVRAGPMQQHGARMRCQLQTRQLHLHCGQRQPQALHWKKRAGLSAPTGPPFSRAPRPQRLHDRGLASWLAGTGSSHTQHILPRAPPLWPPRRCPCTAALTVRRCAMESSSTPSRLMLAARSRRPKCSAPCAGACASPFPWRVAAAVSPAAAPTSMRSAITAPHAPAAACWPDEPRSSNAHPRVAREAVGAECRVVPQQWLLHTTAPGIPADDRRRLDFVLYMAPPGVAKRYEALCCNGRPQPGPRDRDGAAIEVARRRKLAKGGPGPGASSRLRRRVTLGTGRETAVLKSLAPERLRGARAGQAAPSFDWREGSEKCGSKRMLHRDGAFEE